MGGDSMYRLSLAARNSENDTERWIFWRERALYHVFIGTNLGIVQSVHSK